MARALRIVYVSWEYPPQFGGGIGTYVHAAARTMAQRGHDVTVVTLGREPFPQRENDGGIHVLRLPLAPGATDDPAGVLRAWQHRSDAVAKTLHALVRRGVDLIEFADYRGEGVTWLGTTDRANRPPSIVRLQTPLSVLYKYNPGQPRVALLEEYEHQALRMADHIVSPCRAMSREVREKAGESLRIETLACPADPTFIAAGENRSPMQGARDVLYVGRFEERKGIETLARAAEALLAACPEARLVMIGGDTERQPGRSMREYVRGLLPRRFLDRIELVDRVTRDVLRERYTAARVCVFPSHFENFPNTCLEAMALGRPVVGTDNSGMAEMIEPEVSGFIARAADAGDLAQTLIRAFQMSDDALERIGGAAHERIRALYHPDVIGAQTEAVFERFIAEHPRAAGAPADQRPSPLTAAGRVVAPPAGPVKVAFIVPCFNHGRYLPETLASIQAQTHRPVETVVVDDGSTDPETVRVLESLRAPNLRVIHQANAGLAEARNTGVRATDAPFFVPLDADDRIDPTFVEMLLPILLADESLGYAYSQVQFFGAASGAWDCPQYDPRRLLIDNQSVATALIRRAAYDEVGGYSRDMIYGFEDWDFWIALLAIGYHGRMHPERLFHYRKHAGGSMLSQTQQRRSEMIHKMIEHHRALYSSMIESSLTEKDRMFYQAHVEAWKLRESFFAAGGGGGERPAGTTEDALYQRLLAEAELNHIENSRTWRSVQRLKRFPPYRLFARLRHGRDWETRLASGDPHERLRRIKSSTAYRLIQLMKALPFYQWYARRKYGPDFGNKPA
ncbi:MAG: hypothetical protein AMXMBFR47_11270 [Planctomycetota bacterium]